MKNTTIILLAVSLCFTSCGGGIEEPYTEEFITQDDTFKSIDGNFKIKFAGSPTKDASKVETEIGDIEMVTYIYEKSLTEVYIVAYNDYPSVMVEMSDPSNLLEDAKGGSLNELGILSLEIDEEIEKDGNPGIHFKGNNGKFYVDYQMYLVKNRLYQIQILRDGSYAAEENSSEFFSSFEFL